MNQTKKLSILNKSNATSRTTIKLFHNKNNSAIPKPINNTKQISSRRPSQIARPMNSPKSPTKQKKTMTHQRSTSAPTPKPTVHEEEMPWKEYDMIGRKLSLPTTTLIPPDDDTVSSFLEAETLQKKLDKQPLLLDSLYTNLRVQVGSQRAALACVKLECLTDSVGAHKSLGQIQKDYLQLEHSIDEFYFASRSTHDLSTSYLKHMRLADQNCARHVDYLLHLLSRLEQQTHTESFDAVSVSSSTSSSSSKVFSNKTSITAISESDETWTVAYLEQRIDYLVDKLLKKDPVQREADLKRASDDDERSRLELERTIKQKDELLNEQREMITELENALEKQRLDIRRQAYLEAELGRRSEENEQLGTKVEMLSTSGKMIDDMIGQLEIVKQKEYQIRELRTDIERMRHIYTTRESGFILQSASIEAELEKVLKEYDKLTRNIIDFNHERKLLEDEIDGLKQQKYALEQQLLDQKVQRLSDGEGQTTVLRKEFRQLMQYVKQKHAYELSREVESKRRVEQELRQVKAETEKKRWDKVNVGVQTHVDVGLVGAIVGK